MYTLDNVCPLANCYGVVVFFKMNLLYVAVNDVLFNNEVNKCTCK